MKDWENPEKYRPCVAKEFDAWLCRPPLGTVIINKFEQPELYSRLGGREFFRASEYKALGSTNPDLFELIEESITEGEIHITTESNPLVLCTSFGWLCVKSGGFGNYYQMKFCGDIDIKKYNRYGYWSDCNGSVLVGLGADITDWTPMKCISYSMHQDCSAVRVPLEFNGEIFGMPMNKKGIPHGKVIFLLSMNVRIQRFTT